MCLELLFELRGSNSAARVEQERFGVRRGPSERVRLILRLSPAGAGERERFSSRGGSLGLREKHVHLDRCGLSPKASSQWPNSNSY